MRENIEAMGTLTIAQGFHSKYPSPDDTLTGAQGFHSKYQSPDDTLTGAQDFYSKFPSPDDFSPKSKPKRLRIQE